MTFSDQYGNYSAETRTWQPRDPAPEKKVTRVELNHMAPLLFDVASLQCQDLPNMKATAGTDSSSAASAQQCADTLIWWMWEQGGYDDKNFEVRFAAGVGGNWFLYPLWDASAGRLVDVVDHYEPVPGPPDPVTGVPSGMSLEPVMKKVREGNFADRTVSCFSGLPDPASVSEWDGEGFAIHERLPLATLQRLYPAMKEFLVIDRSTNGSDGTFYAERLKGVSPRTGGMMGSASQEQASETTSVFTIFLRTCDDFYRGRWAVVACGKILYMGDNPVYPSQKEEDLGEEFPQYHWPIWRIGHDLIPGSYFAQGGGVRILGAQRKLNGVASKKLHLLKRVAHPVLVKPKRADFIKSDEPDQQINVSDTLAPGSIYYLQSPNFPQELQYEEKASVEQMETILGVHAGTRGASQEGNSGTKDRQLFQRDLGRLAVVKNRTDRQLAQAFSYKLRLWRRYATTSRTIRIVGENNAIAARQMDMASISAGTDVVVYDETQMPKDPAGRVMHLKAAVDMKALDMADPIQRAGVLEAMGLGVHKHFESTLYADRRSAQDENLLMYDGESPAVEFWHDDLQDLAAHFAEMRTMKWIKATTPGPTDDPQTAFKKQQTRERYLTHVRAHQQSMAMKMQSGAAAQPAPGPGQPPAAPPSPQAPSPQPPQPGAGQAPHPDLASVPPPPQAQAGPPAQRQAA